MSKKRQSYIPIIDNDFNSLYPTTIMSEESVRKAIIEKREKDIDELLKEKESDDEIKE